MRSLVDMARVAGHRRRTTTGAPAPTAAASPLPADAAPPTSAPPTSAPPTPAPATPGPATPEPATPEPSDLVVVGRIGKPQGLKGEVTVEVRTDDPDQRFADGAELLTDPPERGPLTVGATRYQNGRLMIGFLGVPDRTTAEGLRGTLLQVEAAAIPAPEDDDEFHDHVLRGMQARLVDGTALGPVVDVLHLPHGDVLVVRRADNDAELLLPFVRAMVPDVDVAARTLTVVPPPGLLELSDGAGAAVGD